MEHQYIRENVDQEDIDDNFFRDVAYPTEDTSELEYGHQHTTENVGQEVIDEYCPGGDANEVEDESANGNDDIDSSSDYETDDEQSFYEQFKDWHDLTDEKQNNAKRFLEENYTVVELKETFDFYYAKRGKRPTVSKFRKFILRQPGMPRKRKSLDEMNKKMEEKVDEAAELKMKLDLNERELSNSKGWIDQLSYFVQEFSNVDHELLKKGEEFDNLSIQNQKLLLSYNHMKETYSPVKRDCGILLSQLIEKDNNIKSLSQQNKEKDEDIKSLSQQNNEKDEDIKSLSQQNDEKDEDIKSLSQQNDEMDEDIKSLSQQNKEKDEDIKSLSQQNKEKDEDIKRHKMEVANVTQQNFKQQDKIVNQGEVILSLMKEKTLLHEENDDMKVKYIDLKKLNVKQKIELEEKDRSIQKQKLIYQELKSELCDTNSRIETVEKELMNKNCEISKIKSNQKEEHHEMKQLQAQVAELKERLNSRNAVAENRWPACTIL